MVPWIYPPDRYYYGWYGDRPPIPTDGDIKSMVVNRLRENPLTADHDLKVDVKQSVVVLGGEVGSPLAKRAAGDDAWDTPGVQDVSNQLEVRPAA
jgi:osmotically-inducible protein OsmY